MECHDKEKKRVSSIYDVKLSTYTKLNIKLMVSLICNFHRHTIQNHNAQIALIVQDSKNDI